MTSLLEVLGRLHPALLHLPIGMLAALGVLEAIAWFRKKPMPREIGLALVWLCAAAAGITTVTGLVLSQESAYDPEAIFFHKALGIGVGVAAILTAWMYTRGPRRAYGVFLACTLAALIPAGHLGGEITHGEGFITEPLRQEVGNVDPPPIDPSKPEQQEKFDADVHSGAALEIFSSKCVSCHGTKKTKGGLALHTLDAALAGGDSGSAVTPGDPADSEIIRRLRLPLDDDDHMPPKGKSQPTDLDIKAIEAWIAGLRADSTAPIPTAGGPDAGQTGGSASRAGHSEAGADESSPASAKASAVPPADPTAIASLRGALAHAEPIAPNSNLWWVSFAAPGGTITDERAAPLLSPLVQQIDDLSLARTVVTDASAGVIAAMPSLRRLDLRNTAVGDGGLAKLAALPRLAELNLTATPITDASVPVLASMAALRRVELWGTKITPEGASRLRASRPDLVVIAEDPPLAQVIETEEPVKLIAAGTPPTPAAGAAASTTGAGEAALTPVNTVCPVSGSPVDPKYLVVHDGKVIGFCCPNCPKAFWDDPSKFTGKLK